MRTDDTRTHQEIFNAAWTGLKAQGWQKAVWRSDQRANPWQAWDGCTRHDLETGNRCALGHVDLQYNDGLYGVYVRVPSEKDFAFCHNHATSPADMERRFREYAAHHRLTIPGDEAKADEALFAAFKAKILAPLAVTV